MERLHRTLEGSYTKADGVSADPEDALMALLNLMNEHVGGGGEILAAVESKKPKAPAAKSRK
jgi:hypothetical protein